jgi:uncharacterized protein YbcI
VDIVRCGASRPLTRAACVSIRKRDGTSRLAARTGSSQTFKRHRVPAHETSALGPLLAEVTNAVVKLHRTHYGKGPTRSKSYMIDDVLMCVMRDVFTPVERTLIESGDADKVRETRLAFQDAMRGSFTEAVERIMERRVTGFTSQVLLDQDIAIEMFVLEPLSDRRRAGA